MKKIVLLMFFLNCLTLFAKWEIMSYYSIKQKLISNQFTYTCIKDDFYCLYLNKQKDTLSFQKNNDLIFKQKINFKIEWGIDNLIFNGKKIYFSSFDRVFILNKSSDSLFLEKEIDIKHPISNMYLEDSKLILTNESISTSDYQAPSFTNYVVLDLNNELISERKYFNQIKGFELLNFQPKQIIDYINHHFITSDILDYNLSLISEYNQKFKMNLKDSTWINYDKPLKPELCTSKTISEFRDYHREFQYKNSHIEKINFINKDFVRVIRVNPPFNTLLTNSISDFLKCEFWEDIISIKTNKYEVVERNLLNFNSSQYLELKYPFSLASKVMDSKLVQIQNIPYTLVENLKLLSKEEQLKFIENYFIDKELERTVFIYKFVED